MKSTVLLRSFLALLVFIAVLNLHSIDAVLAHVWSEVIYRSELFRHDSFEVLLSAFLFATYTNGWIVVDLYVPSAHIYRIAGSSASNESCKDGKYALLQETLWYILPWMLLDFVVPRRHLLLSHFSAPPTICRVIQDVCFTLVLHDFLFYIGHLNMHRNRYLFTTVHSKHHTMGKYFAHVVFDKNL